MNGVAPQSTQGFRRVAIRFVFSVAAVLGLHSIAAAQTSPLTVQFSSSSYNVNEGAGSATTTVTLSAASAQTVTVDYATSDGIATAPSDYSSASGTLTFSPGQTSKTFSVSITNDSVVESDETVYLTLSNPSNATLGISTATLTIEDDDSPTSYSVSVTVTASDLGPLGISEQGQAPLTADATLSISGSPPSGPLTGPIWSWQVVLVQYSSDGVTYTSSPGGDHTSIDHPDDTVADATLIASFDIEGYWEVTVQATATYYLNGTPVASNNANGKAKAKADDKFDIRNNGAIEIVGTLDTATTSGTGSGPIDGALVSAGQNGTFQLVLKDMDQISKAGAADWKDFGTPPNWPGNYSIKLTLVNAKFTDTKLRTRTTNATRGEGDSGRQRVLACLTCRSRSIALGPGT